MVDGTGTIKEVAKATRAVAETAGKVVDFADGVSTYSTRLIGDALAEGGGILHDQIKHWRKMRMLDLEAKFNAACVARNLDPETMRPLSLGQTVRILESASLEETDEVQQLWAELLANTVDPRSGITFKKLYVSLLREIGPAEAALLQLISDFRPYIGRQVLAGEFEKLGDELTGLANARWRQFPEADRLGAITNLRRLGCIAPDLTTPPIERLLTQHAVPAPRHGLSSIREARVTGVDPREFLRFIDWILEAMAAAGGAKTASLPESFPIRNALGGIVGHIPVPELTLTLTPLGDDLVSACSAPSKQETA